MTESVTALFIGLCTGIFILVTTKRKSSHLFVFDEHLFFIYLLPPIIFNAGVQVKKKQFFQNFITISLLGAVGSLISFVIIWLGSTIMFENLEIGFLDLKDYLALGAIFSATDTVCTLQVLNQDETPLLYSLVFGEALWQLLGIVVGLLTAYIIKKLYLGRHSTDREVALMILMAYLSYMVAELFDLSSILTVFFCGIVMSHYTWHNVTEKSRVTTKHGFATLSFISEIFIFLYVGMDALDIEKWKFVSKSPGKSIGVSSILLVLVLVGRAASVFPLCLLSNLFRKSQSDKIGFKQQVTVWWAGLMRGAVSVALAYNWFTMSGRTQRPGNAIMITSTITVVLFTNVVCGVLTKPLVRFLSPQQHKQSTNNMSSELSSEMSLVLPVLTNREDQKQDSMSGSDPHPNLRMLLTRPTRSVHYYWRMFDDAFMRPVFGGRGFVPHVPSPEQNSLHERLLPE
ncbi:hypothetical protein ACLB2K_015678 [Fragaria x ananassa]